MSKQTISRKLKRGHFKQFESSLHKGLSELYRKTRNGFYIGTSQLIPTVIAVQFCNRIEKRDIKKSVYDIRQPA